MKKIIIIVLSVVLFCGIKSYAEEDCFFESGKGALRISVSSGHGNVAKAELLVIDPIGRKTGMDIIKGEILKEIPCGRYGKEAIGDFETGEVGIDINIFELVAPVDGKAPMDGIYKLNIIGTSVGRFEVGVFAYYDTMALPSIKKIYGTTYPGKIDHYEITYSSTAGSEVKVTFVGSSNIPVFDGKGQRPTDVNKFLQYFNPTQARTELPAGTQNFNLSIIYGNTIKRETFSAILGGKDITKQFDPLPGKHEIVKIPLIQGSNTLVLSVKGLRTDGKVAEDTDRLVFIVP